MLACGGGHTPVFSICFELGCMAYPCMCNTDTCSCHGPHEEHGMIGIQGFQKKLLYSPKVSDELKHVEKIINSFIDIFIASLNKVKTNFKMYIDGLVGNRYNELRRKLLAKEQLSAKEMTGDSIGRMLDEIKRGVKISIRGGLSQSQIQDIATTLQRKMGFLIEEIEDLCKLPQSDKKHNPNNIANFSNKVINTHEVDAVPVETTFIKM
jgi:hypothetical protein